MMALTGKLYMAGPYDENTIQDITQRFEEKLGDKVDFVVKQDEHLIGGFRAMINGTLYDASVLTKMDNILIFLKSESQG